MKNTGSSRAEKVASEIKKVVSECLIRGNLRNDEIVSPLLIAVTDVVVSSCLRHAKIFVSSISDDLSNDLCIDYLEKRTQQIRKAIGIEVKLKFVPEIRFLVDDSREKAQRIESLLSSSS